MILLLFHQHVLVETNALVGIGTVETVAAPQILVNEAVLQSSGVAVSHAAVLGIAVYIVGKI
jgi:uncharacterized membrane protein YwaF